MQLDKNGSFLKSIYRIVFIIVVSLVCLTACYVYIQYQLDKLGSKKEDINRRWGRQEVLVQSICKDTNLLYFLKKELYAQDTTNSAKDLTDRIQVLSQDIRNENKEFSDNLRIIKEGYASIDNVRIFANNGIDKPNHSSKQIEGTWLQFQAEVDGILVAGEFNNDIEINFIHMNDKNQVLIPLLEQINATTLEDSFQIKNFDKYTKFTFLLILGGVITILIFYIISNIMIPFHKLYIGISEIGSENHQDLLIDGKYSQKKFPIVHEVNNLLMKINKLFLLISNMNNNDNFMEMLEFINHTFSVFIPYNYIGIALVDSNLQTLTASYGVSDGTTENVFEKLSGIPIDLNETSLGKVLKSGEARIINDLNKYTENKPKNLYNTIVMQSGIRASITLPLKVANEPVGVIFFSSTQKNVYNKTHIQFLNVLADSIAVSFNQNIFIRDLLYSSVLALAKMADARDEDTGEHLDRMKVYTKIIAECLLQDGIYTEQIGHNYIDDLERFSPIHDIGKVGIRDSILLKRCKLTPEEFCEMKQHAIYGAEVLRAAEKNLKRYGKSMFKIGIEIAESHHEKWDGTGYPFGLKGSDIPLSARIVAVADVFDALTSKRPYKEPFSFKQAISIIYEGSGKHFDPDIVRCVQNHIAKLYIAYERYHMYHEEHIGEKFS